MKKIYKRETDGKIERFIVANLNGCVDDEADLLREFNTLQIHEFTTLFQRNPVRMDENTFECEHLRLEVEYRSKLLRIFACNNIDEFIKIMVHAQSEMEKKDEEISDIVESLKHLPSVLDRKKSNESNRSLS